MLGDQDGVLGPQGACRLEPLVGVEFLRVVELRVGRSFQDRQSQPGWNIGMSKWKNIPSSQSCQAICWGEGVGRF